MSSAISVQLHTIAKLQPLHRVLHGLDQGRRVLGVEPHLGDAQDPTFYPGDDGGDVASNIGDSDPVSNSDIREQAWATSDRSMLSRLR